MEDEVAISKSEPPDKAIFKSPVSSEYYSPVRLYFEFETEFLQNVEILYSRSFT